MRTSLRTKKILLVLIVISSLVILGGILFLPMPGMDIKEQLLQLAYRSNILHVTPSRPQQGTRAHRHLTHEQVSKRFQERLRTLHAACKVYANSTLFRPLRNDTYLKRVGPFRPVMKSRLKYCSIEKTASTTWSGVFSDIARAGKKLTNRTGQFRDRSTKEMVFVFVREPYARLLSAYVDKLFSPNTFFWATIGRYIIANFRKNASETSLRCGHDVTFPEYVRYVIHAQRTGEHRDGHFVPTHDHCHMCHYPFQYVGHLETLGEDMAYLLNISQAPYTYTQNFDSSTLSGNAGWVLKTMRKGIQKCMSLQEACRRLWKKWHIRGIISKTEPAPPLSLEEADAISKEDFVKLAEAALGRSGPKETRKRQKTEALREAFASVPLEVRYELQQTLFLDFALFNFPSHPEPVFPSDPIASSGDGYRYFDLGPDQAELASPMIHAAASDDVHSK